MLIPSIDISKGRAVQWRQGREFLLDGGDPFVHMDRFARLGEVAIVDLDAAVGEGDNREIIERLCRRGRCRVGGGIRDRETAIRWLDAGASKVVIGTAATPELLSTLPRDRVIAAVDAWDGEVVDRGWRRRTGDTVEARIERLRPFVSGFLATFVEHEGTGAGLDLERATRLRGLVGDRRLVAAGGTRSVEEIAALDRIGVDVQVGRALYEGGLDPAEIIGGLLRSDRPDGLWPTVVCDESGAAMGLAWSNPASLRRAIDTGRGVYWSRRRGLWEKGATSGAEQELVRVDLDCDRDAIRFTVRQRGVGFCHEGTFGCWGDRQGVPAIADRITERISASAPGSYTARLASDADLLRAKLVEEAGELAEAVTTEETIHEAADLLYFAMTTLASRGVGLDAVVAELERRTGRVTRRGGDAKTPQLETTS